MDQTGLKHRLVSKYQNQTSVKFSDTETVWFDKGTKRQEASETSAERNHLSACLT
jgi:hypothetical protein